MEERAEHEAELKKEAEALSETLKGITLEFRLSTGKMELLLVPFQVNKLLRHWLKKEFVLIKENFNWINQLLLWV